MFREKQCKHRNITTPDKFRKKKTLNKFRKIKKLRKIEMPDKFRKIPTSNQFKKIKKNVGQLQEDQNLHN